MTTLWIGGATVRYLTRSQPALRSVDLELGPGELVGVSGRNGAGKSTLALLATGFIPRVVRAEISGEVLVDERPTRDAALADLVTRVGICFPTPANQLSASKLTVREELAFGLENLGVARAEMDWRIERTLDELKIAHLAERLPTALSGGEQQRVAIASVLVMGPGLLVLDEPTAQLDPAASELVGALLSERAGSGVGVLIAEHKPTLLGRTGRCLVLEAGEQVCLAPPGEALGSRVQAALGGLVPPLVAVAEGLGLDPSLGFRPVALAERIRADGSMLRSARLGGRPSGARRVPAVDWRPAREHAPTAIAVEGLVFRYPSGIEALAGVDLAVAPGESVAIVGQNGSGKTTLAKHLIGLLRASQGRVLIGGRDVAAVPVPELARAVGFAFQDPDSQLFCGRVADEVAFGPANLGLGGPLRERLTAQAMAAAGLDDRAQTNPYDLDLSARKLVALASVLAMDPAVLVLDEPTTGQDGPGMARVGAIVDAFREAGRTVIAISHDMEFAARHFGRVVVMRQGRVVLDGPPGEVFAAGNRELLRSTGLVPPPTAEVAALLGLEGVPLTPAELLEMLARRS